MLYETRKILLMLHKLALDNLEECDVCWTIATDINGILLREGRVEIEQELEEDKELTFDERDPW